MDKNKIKNRAYRLVGRIVSGLSQKQGEYEDNNENLEFIDSELLCSAAAEGAVLLRNDNVLPFDKSEQVAVFGRVAVDWFYVGYGSGGDVNAPYKVNLLEGLQSRGLSYNTELAKKYLDWIEKNPADHGFWGHWPMYHPEMPIDELSIKRAATQSPCAVVVIGRAAGEDRENLPEKGSYYLTDDEIKLVTTVNAYFKKTAVVLNIGSIIDISPIDSLCKNPLAILIAWQGGMESGSTVADLLYGNREPSGRLTDTIAARLEDYPSADNFGGRAMNFYAEDIFVGYRYFNTFPVARPLYPFGFGLGYAKFSMEASPVEIDGDCFSLRVKVKNISERASGKETVLVFVSAPQGRLGKPAMVLTAFAKTKQLSPNEEQELALSFDAYSFSSYDDSGKAGCKNCYILEKGEYKIYVGKNVADTSLCGVYSLDKTRVIKSLHEAAAAEFPYMRMTVAVDSDGILHKKWEDAPTRTVRLKPRIMRELPAAKSLTGDIGLKLADVKSGKCSLDEFTAQLSLEELEAISRGDYTMNSPLGPKGNAGAIGGVTESLRAKGIPAVITTDGPSGIRLKARCSLMPIGTLLASTWNTELVYQLYCAAAHEMKARGTNILLAPGMNIHRHPLCGRNFEYYSEDPLLSGKIAAAAVRGIQSTGLSACPKHFACNNQETRRNTNDSRLSERALREIYLKGFEICIKEARPLNIMTSYNKINGVWGHYHYELCQSILRGEWGYRGNIMTDWWMKSSKSPEFPKLCDQAYRVRAGVDVLMPGGSRSGRRKPDGTLLKTYGKSEGITLGELQRTAKHVLEMCLTQL